MPRNNRQRALVRTKVRSKISMRPQDPIIPATRIRVPNAHIPQHIDCPAVRRTVRLVVILTSGAPTVSITYGSISAQDALDYLGSTANLRYSSIRVLNVKAWAESPNALSVSQEPYGLVITESYSGLSIRDKPTTGSRLASIGIRLPFFVRTSFLGSSSTTPIIVVSCDSTIAASTDYAVTLDFSTEFVS